MGNYVISHKLIYESQYTMTKSSLNYKILLTSNHQTYSLNNYISNNLTTSKLHT
jgi:hypothetical protein